MNSKKPHRPSPNERTMRPVFLIFCEGITEENYIHMLQRFYHAQIRVITQVEGQSICQRLIRKHKDRLRLKPNEVIETFLMYDLDVNEVNKKLFECDAIPLFSNPCVELWFLLHSKDQKGALSSDEVIRELKKSDVVWRSYQKGDFTINQKQVLWNKRLEAVKRAKLMKSLDNPSSGVFILIEKLEKLHDCTESSYRL